MKPITIVKGIAPIIKESKVVNWIQFTTKFKCTIKEYIAEHYNPAFMGNILSIIETTIADIEYDSMPSILVETGETVNRTIKQQDNETKN